MRIHRLVLQSHHPDAQAAFWGHTLSLPVARCDGGAVDITLGSSLIRFEPASAPIDARYHFAINIPRGAINEAASWIAERHELLEFHEDPDEAEGATIVHTDRGAAALYFIDGGGNVAELISPAEGERGDGRPFGAHCLLEVAEIGVATADVERTRRAVLDVFGAAVHWGGGPGSMLTAIGDDHGVVIVSPVGRGWIPVGLEARPLPTTIAAAAPRPREVILEEGPYVLRAT
jgi:hypothetical protein